MVVWVCALVCSDEKEKSSLLHVVPRHLRKALATERVRWSTVVFSHEFEGGGGGGAQGGGSTSPTVHQSINANVRRTCIKRNVPGVAAIGQWHPNLNHEVQMVACRQSGADVGSPRPTNKTLVAWDEPWPHLTTKVLTVGK